MIEHDTFEEWLKGQRQSLQTLVDSKSDLDPLIYIKVLAQALAIQETLNAWEWYQRHGARAVLPEDHPNAMNPTPASDGGEQTE